MYAHVMAKAFSFLLHECHGNHNITAKFPSEIQRLLNDINVFLIINVLVLIIMSIWFRRHGLGRRRAHVPRPATSLLHALTARTHVHTAALHAALILLRRYTSVDLLLTIYITLLLQICIYQANPYSLSKWCHNVNACTFISKTICYCVV